MAAIATTQSRIFAALVAGMFVSAAAAESGSADASFDTPITSDLLDNQVTAEWLAGKEESRQDFLDAHNKPHFRNPLTWFVVMPGSRLGFNGILFGEAPSPGPRHLRVGLKKPVAVGTLLTRGRLTGVSVLKSAAAYPGDLGDDSQWIPAERQRADEVSVWILPPGVSTRAIRFTYDSPDGTTDTAGQLRGVYVMAARHANAAPTALAFASSNSKAAAKVIDGTLRGQWSNDPPAADPPLSPQHSEWLMLAWPEPVALRGLCGIHAVFGPVDVQRYIGPAGLHPREANENHWETLTTGTCDHRTPESFNLNWLDFGREVTTRAIRLRILGPAVENNHLKGQTQDGRRCMLGELLALKSLGDGSIPTPGDSDPAAALEPPIPVTFTMPAAGFVTLAIDDAQGVRVRNLVSDTFFAAGCHTVYWDGLDESGKIPGPYHGIYRMVGHPVAPGTYTVRGLYHGPFDLRYEMSVYSPGSTPWLTASHHRGGTGGWLADHSAPAAVLYLPGAKLPEEGLPEEKPRMLLTSPVAESSHGVIWTDLEGNKLDGKLWVGGIWTGATHLARDRGQRAVADVSAYSGSVWEGGLRLVAFTPKEYRTVAPYAFADKALAELGGLAVHDGLLVASLPKMNALLLVNASAGKVIGTVPMQDGRGLAFDAQGRLWALSGRRLVRYATATAEQPLPEPEEIVAEGLLDPRGLAIDDHGAAYVSDWGTSHQVKVFAADGSPRRTIGSAGGARLGTYDQLRMDHPRGLAITPAGELWVAESSHAPKRVSIWKTDGSFVKAFYGPPQYGGGGTLDPRDSSRFYYAGQGGAGLEFRLDWVTGKSALQSIYAVPGGDGVSMPGEVAPQTPIYVGDHQYMTDVNNSRPVGGPRAASIWRMVDGAIVPAASLGEAALWPVLAEQRFESRWPEGVKPGKPEWKKVMYAWSDRNEDGAVTPDEVGFVLGRIGSLTVNDRLEFCTAAAEVFAPEGFTRAGVPIYELSKGRKQLPDFFMTEVGSGSGQIVSARDGWTVGTGGPVRGIRGEKVVWTYPNEWPSQQAGVVSTPPTRRGELMATTRHLGLIRPHGSDAGEILVIDGDKGNIFLLTTDGLFVATLFHDVRRASKTWTMPEPRRGMLLNDITLYDEEFWTTCTQAVDGTVHLVAGKSHCSLVRVDNLDTIRRLPSFKLEVTPELLEQAGSYRLDREAARQAAMGRDLLEVRIAADAPKVDGALDEWGPDRWVTIDERDNERLNAQAGGRVEAAIRIAGDRLYAAFRTKDRGLLTNGGDAWQFLFKTGGALDVMLGTNPAADPKRTKAEAGDLRLLVTMMKGKPTAVLYQPVAADRKHKGSFSSPLRTIEFDRVQDVSDGLKLSAGGGGYEFSIPLATLGLSPQAGLEVRGDVGILGGNGFQTLRRVYWQNKATSIVADVPTEATLTPHLWGMWRFDGKEDR